MTVIFSNWNKIQVFVKIKIFSYEVKTTLIYVNVNISDFKFFQLTKIRFSLIIIELYCLKAQKVGATILNNAREDNYTIFLRQMILRKIQKMKNM